MIYLFTDREYDFIGNDVKYGDIDDFYEYARDAEGFQLDTETTMVDDGPNAIEDRELVLLQIGDLEGEHQYLFEYEYILSDKTVRNALTWILSDNNKYFICHNARFEYIIIKKSLGISIENLHDTFLMSKILNTGLDLDKGYHSLAGCLHRFFGISMNKAEQTTFSFGPLTENQVIYAADDVLMLKDLFDKLKELLKSWDLWFLYDRVERQVLKVYADMMMSPMQFDKKHWMALNAELRKEDEEIEKELNQTVFEDPKLVEYLKRSNIVLGISLIQPKDTININWASNITRKALLIKIIPELNDLQKFTKPELKKIQKSGILSSKSSKILDKYLNREYAVLNRYLRLWFKDYLIENGWFIPKNTLNINWSSQPQRLYVFQFYYPNMQDTNAKTLARIYTNKLINKYKQYVKVHKSVTTYGENFIKRYVNRHGGIALTKVVQILTTGRIAGGILLQLPAQARFRNAFLPPKDDWVFVDSDYASAEVVILAHASQETAFLNAIKEGKDLHMMSASLIFADKWKKVAEPGCVHITTGARCSCEEHNKLRQISKSITFGLSYGLTHIGLSERLDISRKEAKELFDKFFATFTKVRGFLDTKSKEGMDSGHVISLPPTKRIRFFPPPEHQGELQAIGREARNFPIQETNASMLKIAMIKLRNYIIANDFPAKLHMPVHDEILSSCPKDRSEEWRQIQDRAMKEAADLFLEKGLLGVDSKILEKWTK